MATTIKNAANDNANGGIGIETLEIRRVERRASAGGAWASGTLAGHRFDALVFAEPATNREWEVGGDSRISKLWVERISDRATVYNWRRGPRTGDRDGRRDCGPARRRAGRDDRGGAMTESIGASEIAACVGLSPYAGPADIWARYALGVRTPENEAMARGKRLESYVLDWAADELPFPIIPNTLRRVASPLHATPDALSADGTRGVEAKTTRDARGYGESGTDQIPVGYQLQCQAQIRVYRFEVVYVPVMLPYFERRLYQIEPNREIGDMLEDAARNMLRLIEARTPPPNCPPPSYELMRAVERAEGKEITLDRPDLFAEWRRIDANRAAASAQLKADVDACNAAKSAILALAGDASIIRCPGVGTMRIKPVSVRGYSVEPRVDKRISFEAES